MEVDGGTGKTEGGMSRRIVSAWDRRMADFDGTGPIEKEINRKIDHGGESPKIHPQEMTGVIWPPAGTWHWPETV